MIFHIPWTRMMALALVLCIVSGCGIGRSVKVDIDSDFDAGYTKFFRTGEQVKVRDLTDFEWDRFILFPEATSYEDIDRMVGSKIERVGLYSSNSEYYTRSRGLAVFQKDGRVVEADAMTAFALTGAAVNRWWGPEAEFQKVANNFVDVVEP